MDGFWYFYGHFGSRQPQSSNFLFIYFKMIIIWKNVARILKIFSLLKVNFQINGAKRCFWHLYRGVRMSYVCLCFLYTYCPFFLWCKYFFPSFISSCVYQSIHPSLHSGIYLNLNPVSGDQYWSNLTLLTFKCILTAT